MNTALNRFQANTWVEVGKEGVEAKVKALGMYRGVMRPYPHPSRGEEEGVKNLRVLRTDIYLRRYSYSVTLRPEEINTKRVLGRLTRVFSFFYIISLVDWDNNRIFAIE